jgi:hypothetical protein
MKKRGKPTDCLHQTTRGLTPRATRGHARNGEHLLRHEHDPAVIARHEMQPANVLGFRIVIARAAYRDVAEPQCDSLPSLRLIDVAIDVARENTLWTAASLHGKSPALFIV